MNRFSELSVGVLLTSIIVTGYAPARAADPLIHAHENPWAPAPPAIQIPLWPETPSIARPATMGGERYGIGAELIAGKPVVGVENVSRPTLSIYPPKGRNTGVTVVVFPGGGYQLLAIDLEGTEVCDWLTAKGVTCVVLKYRVPGSGPWWDDTCDCRKIPAVPMALQDAQRAIGMLRERATALHIDPRRVGVLGFSAGGRLVADVSNHEDRAYAPIDAADKESSRPDFAVLLYPGHLWEGNDLGVDLTTVTLDPTIKVSAKTPPTFILQAENDPVDNVRHSLTYFLALKHANVSAEMHIYAEGGHAFGLRRTSRPITEWPDLVWKWLHTIGMLPGTR